MQQPILYSFVVLLFLSPFSAAAASSSSPLALPDPDPSPLQPLTNPSTTTTIPAFPEQSDISSSSSATSSSSCPLSLPADLIHSLSTACPADRPSASCCPSLAAFLYSAFAPTALSLPAAARADSLPLPDLPDLPDDSESCAGQVEKSLRARGVELPRLNDTCDAAYCYCGVRLRRLTCAGGGGFVVDEREGRWVATPATGRRLQRACRRPGLAGCGRCVRALDQLTANTTSRSSTSKSRDNDRECQLMGLTWLLSKNRTLYLPTATSVLRAYMAAGAVGPASCSVQMPFAVGSDEIDSRSSAAAGISFTFIVVVHYAFIMLMVL